MVGLIVCGHGNFATGILSAVELMAGQSETFKAIDFVKGLNPDNLKEQLAKAIEEVGADGAVVFADIAGGTPFKQASLIAAQNPKVKVIGGTNMPLLLDALFLKDKELEPFMEEVLSLSKGSIKQFQMKVKKPACGCSEEGGI